MVHIIFESFLKALFTRVSTNMTLAGDWTFFEDVCTLLRMGYSSLPRFNLLEGTPLMNLHDNGKSLFSTGNTSSNDWFPLVMLVLGGGRPAPKQWSFFFFFTAFRSRSSACSQVGKCWSKCCFFLEVKENLGKGRVFETFFPHTKAWWERFLFSKLAKHWFSGEFGG